VNLSDPVEVLRLLQYLPDPFEVLGVERSTNFDKVSPQLMYVEDEMERGEGPGRDVEYSIGRIRHFRDLFLEGKEATPIELDNKWGPHSPVSLALIDGHHRLCGAILAKSVHVVAAYSGEVEALKWLKGERRTPPAWLEG